MGYRIDTLAGDLFFTDNLPSGCDVGVDDSREAGAPDFSAKSDGPDPSNSAGVCKASG